MQGALAAAPSAWQVEVWLGTTVEEARRRTNLPRAFFVAAEGGCLLRSSVEDLGQLARYLAGMGVPLAIRQPPELRVALRRYALALARDARRTGD